ncbi:hypothetical protein [uncultured Megasphaera sp.]|uniref:nucleotide-binding domain-containing protein n=1 Tax=uncultured Megasphaera sp. TaxID=165188 RepID=UPI0025E14FE9|nr:hypothetical protein [uncultured Megasphaera sp.]
MSLSDDFKTFCENISLNNLSDMENTASNIAKKLNKHYYELDGESKSHMYIVGSVGRQTAITGSSDLDLLFDMPSSVFSKYDNYESNGQSALLQDVKNVLIEKYPKTDISGDGQVVVINFNKYTVELVPGFKQSDDRFKYPDTHDGGSWKITDPLDEQEECSNCNSNSNGSFYDFCHIIRSWKNNIGLEMGGLLIDTLVYNFFQANDSFSDSNSNDYLNILKDLFKSLKNENPDQNYWLAVGSNQQVSNSNNGAFVSKAKKAYTKLKDVDDSTFEINDVLRELLGASFPKAEESKSAQNLLFNNEHSQKRSKEQFIEQLVPVDIRYNLRIDCKVTQDGWRPFYLLEHSNEYLKHNKQLDFFIKRTDCPEPYDIWWKVRNVGPEAERRNNIRGQILKNNKREQHEHTDFYGPHYVECYLIKNGVCVARDRIDVPIGWE